MNQEIHVFHIPLARADKNLAEAIAEKAEGRRIVAVATMPGTGGPERWPGVVVTLVTEPA